MGLNSFFFTSFVLPQIINGGDVIKGYQAGLVIILISGIIFLLLSVTGARTYIAKAMPECIKKAMSAGIGLFIAFIGFQNVGIIQANQYTLVQFVKIIGANPKAEAKAIAPKATWESPSPIIEYLFKTSGTPKTEQQPDIKSPTIKARSING
jgi:AGZA family xanthine/uracil permease-like MFS transporter